MHLELGSQPITISRKCERCKKYVAEFLWNGDDHPALLEHDITMIADSFRDDPSKVKVTVHAYVERRMCSELAPRNSESILDLDGSTEIERAVGEAIGAASMCWENVDGAGVFDSSRAKQITDELVEYFRWKQPIY